jgi:type II secretory ATPase GspE/PulE/Tfp pilus assembly ATPase PilB-like protein
MSPAMHARWQEVYDKESGLFLCTGRRDSGKTTSAYRALWRMNDVAYKLVTLEKLPGYRMGGVTQMYRHLMPDVTYAQAFDAALRQDPNVLFLGDIETAEHAEAAISAAEQGRWVLATLTAPDPVSAMARLLHWGISPARAQAVVRPILHQSLRPLPCEKCKGTGQVSATVQENNSSETSDSEKENLSAEPNTESGSPTGEAEPCKRCFGTGNYGRTGAFQLLYPEKIWDEWTRTSPSFVTLEKIRDNAYAGKHWIWDKHEPESSSGG